MKTMTAFLLVLTPLILGACGGAGDGEHAAHDESTTETYTCPMHPSVISDRPGACPVCGMSLVKVSAQTDLTAEEEKDLVRVSLSPTQRVLANISTTTAREGEITKRVPLVGFVQVAEPKEAMVAARFRGRIERLHANTTGAKVRTGEPLFEMYSPDLLPAVQEFILALDGSGGHSAEDQMLLDGIRSRLRLHYGMTPSQIADIESTRTARSTVTFLSPIAGTILQKNLREGQYVSEGEVLYKLADLSTVWIILDVYEQDVRHFTIGQTVVISSDAYPGDRFSGRITFIDPVMDPITRSTRVRTEFANRHGKLLPNMFVSATVEITESARLVVPRAAVLETGRRSLVWVEASPNAFVPRQVTVGFKGDNVVEIASGLSPGDKVAATGGFLIDSESALQNGGAQSGHQHGSSAPSVPEASDGVVDITVNGSYSPDVIRVRKGQPLILRFFRNERSLCTKEVKFPELGIQRTLADFDTTEIRITPAKAGTIHFSCGMDMVHGQLIVE